MTTLVSNDCIGCSLRFANGLEPICDGTGVISVSDIPAARVLVCPEWPADEDEPIAFWEAQVGLGYDVPVSLQQRIRSNTMAAVQQIRQAAPTEQHVEAALSSSQKMRRLIFVCAVVCVPFWIGVVALVNWATR